MSAESTATRRRPADADFAASRDVDAALEALRGDLKEKWRESVRICTTTEAALLAKLGRQLDSSFEDYAEDLQSLKVFLQKQIVLLVLPVNSGLIKDFSGGEHWASLYMAPRKGATLESTQWTAWKRRPRLQRELLPTFLKLPATFCAVSSFYIKAGG